MTTIQGGAIRGAVVDEGLVIECFSGHRLVLSRASIAGFPANREVEPCDA